MKRLVYIIILLILAVCFTSCRTQYIPVESVRTEYKTRDSIRIDSIYQRDSIYTLVKGDTVYQYRYKYLYRYLTTNRTDTILKNDSIRVPYPVEKQLNRWQSMTATIYLKHSMSHLVPIRYGSTVTTIPVFLR